MTIQNIYDFSTDLNRYYMLYIWLDCFDVILSIYELPDKYEASYTGC